MPKEDYGTILWSPTTGDLGQPLIVQFMEWLNLKTQGPNIENYDALWRWSVEEIDSFWQSIVDFFEVQLAGEYTDVVDGPINNARWFKGTSVNFGEHVMRHAEHLEEAVIAVDEIGNRQSLSGSELRAHVAQLAHVMRTWGIGKGDVVASLMPNIPESLIAFLATTSVGAVWTSCSPDFGHSSVFDRFSQVNPKLLFAVDGYPFRGKWHDRREAVRKLHERLPSVEQVVVSQRGTNEFGDETYRDWTRTLEHANPGPITWETVPFDHPLWILYSSGTTGLPKAIVHSHGGILLEQHKLTGLQFDLSQGDRFFWHTTTGWMMWNVLVSALLAEATIVMYDGDIQYPDPGHVWQLAADEELTFVGLSAGHIHDSMRRGLEPHMEHDLSRIRTVGSTGSPLTPEGFTWLYRAIGSGIMVSSTSGGTDMATGFLGGAPILPVYAGEIQRAALGADVTVLDANSRELIEEVGELVIRQPMPSMPIYLWGDRDRSRLQESYFEMYPGMWRHGDWTKVTNRGTYVVYGRSDSTLNRGGVRMGTSEFYRVLEQLNEIKDSLVVDTGTADGSGQLVLFIALKGSEDLTKNLRDRVLSALGDQLSPRHKPDHIFVISDIPRTLSGKKMEIPVKRILNGEPADQVASLGAMENPQVMKEISDIWS